MIKDYLIYFCFTSTFCYLTCSMHDELWFRMLFRNTHCVCDNGFDRWPNDSLERHGCDFDRLNQS